MVPHRNDRGERVGIVECRLNRERHDHRSGYRYFAYLRRIEERSTDERSLVRNRE